MRPGFRYAVAASLFVAAFGTILVVGSGSPALADVLKAASQHKLVRYKVKQTTDDKRSGMIASGISLVYADLRLPRFRSENRILTLNETVKGSCVFIQDGAKDRNLRVFTEEVVPAKLNDPKLPDFLKQRLTDGTWPRKEATLHRAFSDSTPATDSPGKTILENVRELEKNPAVTTVRDKRGGKDLVRYRMEEGKTTTTLWVDPNTKLPVRLERDIVDETPDIALNQYLMSDFEWDPALPDGIRSLDQLFNITPPAGYKLTDRTKANEGQ